MHSVEWWHRRWAWGLLSVPIYSNLYIFHSATAELLVSTSGRLWTTLTVNKRCHKRRSNMFRKRQNRFCSPGLCPGPRWESVRHFPNALISWGGEFTGTSRLQRLKLDVYHVPPPPKIPLGSLLARLRRRRSNTRLMSRMMWQYDLIVSDQVKPPVISCNTHDNVSTVVFEKPTWQLTETHATTHAHRHTP